MKYIFYSIFVLYSLLFILFVFFLVFVLNAKDWEMGEGFVFMASVWGLIVVSPFLLWSGTVIKKWPVKLPQVHLLFVLIPFILFLMLAFKFFA